MNVPIDFTSLSLSLSLSLCYMHERPVKPFYFADFPSHFTESKGEMTTGLSNQYILCCSLCHHILADT